MKRESAIIANLINTFQTAFPESWIDNYDWSSADSDAFIQGIRKIKTVADKAFVAFATMALIGEHLRTDIGKIDVLLDWSAEEIVEDDSIAKKSQLQSRYRLFLEALRAAVMLTKHHFNITERLFQVQDYENDIFNVVGFDRSFMNKDAWVSDLNVILDVCYFEYRFSYRKDAIRSLIINREQLIQLQSKSSNEKVEKVVSLAIEKIDFLLLKLSHFAKDKRIEYLYNFEKTIVSQDTRRYESREYNNYLKFIDPEKYITLKDVDTWQRHKYQQWAGMWQMVLLMRYYTKVTKDVQQADNLLKEYEAFYNEKKDSMFYDFNTYALRSVRVYMYNSLLSLKCKRFATYTFDDLKKDMLLIRAVQNECFIQNYYPYQKAIEYTIDLLKKDIKNKVQKSDVLEKINLLRAWNESYRNNIDWCKEHQCYAFQLTFRECTLIHQEDNPITKVFYPSSFSRPLKFQEINECRNKLSDQITRLEYEVSNYDDILELKAAQKKVADMERKNMETMGIFVTLTTFLVGLLSIFIGNNGEVSIFEKIHYVITLGAILVLFVCLGYFVIGDYIKKYKPFVFGGLAAIMMIVLGVYFFKLSFAENNVKTEKSAPKKVDLNIKELPVVEFHQGNTSK